MTITTTTVRVSRTGISDTKRDETRGMLLGLAAVAMFSLTLPLTRIAVTELDPLFVALGRALGAALLTGLWLLWKRPPLPARADLLPLGVVVAGCIVGFPLLTSIAMRTLPASHGAVLVGVLPLCTALYAAVRGYEHPSRGFWGMAVLGSGLVVAFALSQGGGHLAPADLLVFAAVVAAAAGYAEGGRLSRRMGGQEVISWALVLGALPCALLLGLLDADQFGRLGAVSARVWLAFAYVTLVSMGIAFFFWYHALAIGGMARVGQVQLLQPFLSMLGAAVLLGEPLTLVNCGFALAVIGVVAAGRKMQVGR